MLRAHEARHLVGQELEETLGGPDVEAFRELDPRILVERASDELHVDPVESAAVAQQGVVDLRTRTQFFEGHRLLRLEVSANHMVTK